MQIFERRDEQASESSRSLTLFENFSILTSKFKLQNAVLLSCFIACLHNRLYLNILCMFLYSAMLVKFEF